MADTSDDYYTPRWLFEALGLSFDVDVAAPPGGVPWIPAQRSFSMLEDGLSAPWIGRVWMNPPFSDPTPWVDRFLRHRHGVALLPVVRSRWMTSVWNSDGALTLTPYNMKFERGAETLSILWNTCLLAFGPECVEAVGRIGRLR